MTSENPVKILDNTFKLCYKWCNGCWQIKIAKTAL